MNPVTILIDSGQNDFTLVQMSPEKAAVMIATTIAMATIASCKIEGIYLTPEDEEWFIKHAEECAIKNPQKYLRLARV